MEQKLLGGVISKGNEDVAAIMSLLSHRLRDKLDYVGYHSVSAIDRHRHHDFLVITDVHVIREAIHYFRQLHRQIPLIIHLIYSHEITPLNYFKEFPQVDIAPILQAPLDTPDTTLQIHLFDQIIARLGVGA